MDRRIKRLGIGALAALLMVSMMVAPAMAMAEPMTPFLINGYVFKSDGAPCDNPAVQIESWDAENNSTSNYYQLTLDSDDVSNGDVLQFNTTGFSQSNTTSLTVSQVEINAGGFGLNITLVSPAEAPTLVEYTINNRTITPPQTTEIDVKFSERVKWNIAIEGGSVVRDWAGTSTTPTTKIWNGTYEGTATVVPDGEYVVNITWINTTGSGQNNTENITVLASSDTTDPEIYNVTNNTPTDSSVTITWTTDEEGDSLVKYGTTSGDHPDNESSAAMETSHSIELPGLLPNETYYYVVNSTDASGNSNESTEYNFTTAEYVPPSTTVSIEDVTVASGGNITVPIMVNDVTNLSGCAINMVYNASVVNVTNITQGDMDLLVATFDNGTGWMYASAINATGLSGNVVFAYVTLAAVGADGDISPLNITVDALIEPYANIAHSVINGTFTIGTDDSESPRVADASASRDTILNDNGRARAPGTNVTVLNVTVTDGVSGVANVTINLSSIGGSPVQPMGRIPETDIWTVTTNATDGINLTHELAINATDNDGNYNDTVAIQLTVLRRGDVCRDNVLDRNDLMYIARYLAGLEPESTNPPTVLVGDVVGVAGDPEGDSVVNLMDALYLARHGAGYEDAP